MYVQNIDLKGQKEILRISFDLTATKRNIQTKHRYHKQNNIFEQNTVQYVDANENNTEIVQNVRKQINLPIIIDCNKIQRSQ